MGGHANYRYCFRIIFFRCLIRYFCISVYPFPMGKPIFFPMVASIYHCRNRRNVYRSGIPMGRRLYKRSWNQWCQPTFLDKHDCRCFILYWWNHYSFPCLRIIMHTEERSTVLWNTFIQTRICKEDWDSSLA